MSFSEPTVHNIVSIAMKSLQTTGERVSASLTFLQRDQWRGNSTAKLEIFADISMAGKFERWAKATREIFEEEA